jgi:hypothetical protein
LTRVSQADHVLLLLQEQLQRLGRKRGERSARTGESRAATPRPMARLQASAALAGMSEEEVRRSLVRALLSEELGESIANDPSFQGVLDEVYRVIDQSEEGRTLMADATRQLREAH